MLKNSVFYILPILLVSGSLAIPQAHAAVKHRKKNPVFSAIDDDPGNLPDLEVPVVVPRPVRKARHLTRRARPLRAKARPVAFDTVPASQNAPILRRLELVEEMVRNYGRAYDYRIYTVHELERILGGLKSAQAKDNESRTPLESPPLPPPPSTPVPPPTNDAQ